MLSFLKDHPFAVEAFFDYSTVLTYAVPKALLAKLVPPCLQLDTFNDNWAFVAVAMVQTKQLRPKGFPKCLGNQFFLIGYRIFVRYTTQAGKNLRGLYILKSETDKKKMELLGNIFTHYQYSTIDIHQATENGKKEISSKKGQLKVVIDELADEVQLPAQSPFTDWKEARRFAGPLPFTFSYNPINNEVLIVEGLRENWTPKPLKVLQHQFEFLNKLNLQHATLANAFIIENIPYRWKKGRKEIWKP